MPSLGEIDELMKRWGQDWEQVSPVEGDVFNVLWEIVARYYGSNKYDIRPNYERVLGEMTALASWLSFPPFGNPLIEAVRDGAPVSALKWLHDPSDQHASRKRILSQQTFLLEKLAENMRHRSRAFHSQLREFSNYKEFFLRLRDRFDLGVYNLNYDTVVKPPGYVPGYERELKR